jgi:peroxiredoxin
MAATELDEPVASKGSGPLRHLGVPGEDDDDDPAAESKLVSISVGDRLPDATLLRMGPSGPEEISLRERIAGRKVVLIGLPGPFSDTCTEAHIPSFLRVREALGAKGVDEVICFAVIDPFVMKAWDESSGAGAGGITMLADSSGAFTRALGLAFDAPVVGFYGRTTRHSMVVDDGVVRILNFEETHGVCERTAGEAILEAL